MKKLLLSAIALVAFSSANAQITYKGAVDNLAIPPKEFCYNGQIKFVAEEHDYEKYYKFMTYDENFEVEKTFTFNCKASEYIRTYQRKREGSAAIENYEDELLYENKSSWEEAKAAIYDEWWAVVVEKDNYVIWPENGYNYYRDDIFGTKYPTWIIYWNPENKNVYKRSYSYKTLYTGDWYTYDSTTLTNYTKPCYFTYYDYDNNSSFSGESYGAGFYATQTLFNSDEKYEMLTTLSSQSEIIDDEGDYDGDGEIDHRVIESGEIITGYSIISEDGDVIFSTNYSDNPINWMNKFGEVYILKANGKFYIYDGNIFEINRETSSIKQVAKLKGMRVSPTIAEQTDNITVELGEGSNAKEIVVNGNGQVVKQIPVKNGERQITINAGSLNRGLNILNARGAKGNNNCKIIVK